MKILFINVYYPQFLKAFYSKFGGNVLSLDYGANKQILLNQCFGDADFYSDGVKQCGHEADEIIANDEILQKKWAKENGFRFDSFTDTSFLLRFKYLRFFFKPNWFYKILEAQIGQYNPDIIYFQDIEYFKVSFLSKLRKKFFIIAQKASLVHNLDSFRQANLVFTSYPYLLDFFRKNGVTCEYLKLAFGAKVLDKINVKKEKEYNVSFVGGLISVHNEATRVFEKAAEKIPIQAWGYGAENLAPNSPLRKNHRGEAWGLDMYNILANSKIVLNRHGVVMRGVPNNAANNMRLFEATGVGAFLLTDYKDNLSEFFKVGKEIETYRDADELVEKVNYYLTNNEARERIAKAGQQRTSQDHTYAKRMGEMLSLLSKYYN